MSSQRSQKKSQKAGYSCSQSAGPSTSSQRPGTSSQFVIDDDENLPASQISPDKNLTNQEHMHHVANIVKYILGADHSKIPITKSAISKAVDCHNKNFKTVIEAAIKVLKDTFGYEVVDTDGKLYLYNRIDPTFLDVEDNVSIRYVLLFVVLSHIFMSGGQCPQSSIIDFLTRLGILTEGSTKSDVFGDIINLLTVDFVKEKYLLLEKSENPEIEEPEFKWGFRAELELAPRTVMEFVSEVYRGRSMQSFPQQYERMLKIEENRKGRPKPLAQQNGRAE